MYDASAETVAAGGLPRLEIVDHIEMGRLVVQWAVDPRCRPQSLREARQQMRGAAVVPEGARRIAFCQHDTDTLHLRLPAPDMVVESMAACLDPMRRGGYPLPDFYGDHFRPGLAPVLTPLEMFFARLGDDPIARCG